MIKGKLVKLEVGGKEIKLSDMVPGPEYIATYEPDYTEFLRGIKTYGSVSFAGAFTPSLHHFIEAIQVAVVTVKECFSSYSGIRVLKEEKDYIIQIDVEGGVTEIFNEYQTCQKLLIERLNWLVSDYIILDYNITAKVRSL